PRRSECESRLGRANACLDIREDPQSPSVCRKVGREQVLLCGLPRRDRARQSGDVQEMPIGEVLADAVACPSAGTHRQRESEPVVECTTVALGVCLVHQYPGYLQPFGHTSRLALVSCVNTTRMSSALKVEDALNPVERLVQVM